MKTKFKYYDEINNLVDAELVLSFTYNDKKYVIYTNDKESNNDVDILYVREYEETDGIPHLYKVSEEEIKNIRSIMDNIYNSME